MILLYTCKSVTSKYIDSMIQQINFLNHLEEDIIYITPDKSNKGVKYIENIANLKIKNTIFLGDYLQKNYFDFTYYELSKYLYDKINIKNISKIFVFGGPLSEGAKLKNKYDNFKDIYYSKRFLKFISVGIKQLLGSYFIHYLAEKDNIKIYELLFDPQEVSLQKINKNVKTFHGIDIEKYNIKRLDTLQYYLKNNNFSFFNEIYDKIYDLTFGMTVLTNDRIQPYEKIKKQVNKIHNINFFIKNKFEDIDTFILREDYLEFIKKSRFTFILPSYDKDTFSIYRFLESIWYDCLPLIFNDCRIDLFKKSFNIDEERLRYITISYNEIEFPSEERRLELLNYFKDKCFNKLQLDIE